VRVTRSLGTDICIPPHTLCYSVACVEDSGTDAISARMQHGVSNERDDEDGARKSKMPASEPPGQVRRRPRGAAFGLPTRQPELSVQT
jgi:hypothetical protein